MSVAAAVDTRDSLDWDDDLGSGSGSGPRGPRSTAYDRRFRVVVRRDSAASKRRMSDSLPFAFLAAVVPTTLLLVYVLSWTLAMRAGFYRNELNQRLEIAKIEQAELLAKKRQLQSPGYIQARAEQMGMQQSPPRRFLTIPAAVAIPSSDAR